MSGTAHVRQLGTRSNAVPFNVNTATIATVTPASGVPGTPVTIAGSSFGAAQGSGQVWLGTANAVVQSWSDGQIVATVASGSASGDALVLQNGVMSNPVPFAVNTLQLTTVSPNSGADDPVSVIRFDGTGQRTATVTIDHQPDEHNFVYKAAVHPDGTIFVVVERFPVCLPGSCSGGGAYFSVIGIDPLGGQKFSVQPVDSPTGGWAIPGDIIVAGDGYAYVPYVYHHQECPDPAEELKLVRISSAGAYDDIPIQAVSGHVDLESPGVITNADTGTLVTFSALYDSCADPETDPGHEGYTTPMMAITTGTGVSVLNAPTLGGPLAVQPVLQAQDGSFVGTIYDDSSNEYMIAFDQAGGVRWAVPNFSPLMATADGGVIATSDGVSATTFDQNGSATGQMANMPTLSWRGDVYQLGSVERMAYPPISAPPINMALSLWAWVGGNPSGNGTAARPWYFKLIWQNDCSTVPWPCGFALYPDNPQYQPNLAVDASSQAGAIKSAALAAFKKAFDPYPVSASEGTPNTGDNRAVVVDGLHFNTDGESCGLSAPAPGGHESNVYYLPHMEQAQWALPLQITTFQAAQVAVGTTDLMKAIGTGIGTTAAHETVHQFLENGSGMDDRSQNTYNGQGCRGDLSPWVYGFGPIQWEDVTATALKNSLGIGWHR